MGTCNKWIRDCDVSVLSIPSPLIGLPLPDICQEHLEFVQDGARKLAAFQDSCVSDEDKEYWRLDNTSESRGIAPLSSSKQDSNESYDGNFASGSVRSFFSGLLSGMFVICALLFIIRRRIGGEILYNDLNMKSSDDHQQDRIMV